MTGEESLAYRRRCPYDAMGDYTVFLDSDKGKGNLTIYRNTLSKIQNKRMK